MQMPIVKKMDIVKELVREFSARQRGTSSIRNRFVSAGQDPWKDCSKEFKTHLDRLSELSLYGGYKTTVEGLENKRIKSCEGLLLGRDTEGQIEEGGSGKGDVEVKEDEL